MSTKKQVMAGALGAVLATLVIGIFSTFYDFHGRLSRLEGQAEDLAKIRAAIVGLNVERDVLPIHRIGGLSIPAPTADRPVGGAVALLDTFDETAEELTANRILGIFDPIVDPAALVTLVRNGSIQISDIALRTAESTQRDQE